MTDLALTRSGDDRRRFDLAGVGSLRLRGFLSRGAGAESEGASWSFERSGFWGRAIEATDAFGDVVGTFDPKLLRRGGALRWGAGTFNLRPSSRWRERYALVDEADRELATLEGKGWGRRPVRITVDDPEAVDPGLLLFAAYVVRRLAEDASTTAAGASAGAAA